MEFEASRDSLLEVVKKAYTAIPNKIVLSILKMLSLRLRGNELSIISTSLDLWINARTEVGGSKDGDILIDSESILNLLKELPSKSTVSFKLKDKVLKVKSGNFNGKIVTADSSEFPTFKKLTNPMEMEVSSTDLKYLFSHIELAVSSNSNQPVLSGVYCSIKNNQLIMVGTDRSLLAKSWLKLDDGDDAEIEVIIPIKNLSKIIKVVEGADKIILSLAEEAVMMEVDNCTILTTLIKGRYPDYDKIINNINGGKLLVNTKDLRLAVSLVSTFSPDNKEVSLTFNKEEIEIHANSSDKGDGNNFVSYESSDTLPHQLSLNGDFLVKILDIINTEKSEISFTQNFPYFIKISPSWIEEKDIDFSFILAPITDSATGE